MFIIPLSACSDSASTLDRIQRSGILSVGLDPTYPPFEFYDGATLQGIDVDLAQAIAADMGLTAQFSHFGFDGLYDALATEQVDVLISALPADITRTREFAYSDGYFDSGLVLVSRSDHSFPDVQALAGSTLAVELGAAGHVQATTLQRQVPDLDVITFASAYEALLAVGDHQAQAAIVDNVTYRLFAQADLELVSMPLTSEPYVLVVRREDGKLLSALNDSLVVLHDSGQLDSILSSWMQG